MSTTFPAAILDTILGHLALLFLTGAAGDLTAARHAAREMLAAYQPETPEELHLAAEIISFGLHALDALGQAADQDMSLNRKLRLRGSAVSLSRESHKSQRKLDQLQKTRRRGLQPIETAAAKSEPDKPRPAKPDVETTKQPQATIIKNSGQTWTQAYQQRQAARRIAENLKKNHANTAPHLVAAVGAQNGAPAGQPTHI